MALRFASSTLSRSLFSGSVNCPALAMTQRRYLGEDLNVPGILIAIPEVHSFMERCMEAVGTKKEHSKALADVLLAADYRGHFSHGLNRLEMYVKDIETGITRSDIEPRVVKETVAVAHVDGVNILGPVVGNFCMELAIKKAKQAGIGLVAAKGSNHYGIAGYYSLRAVDAGLLGLSFTNTSPLAFPTRGRKVMLGTNPLTLAAPGQNSDSFVLDMATTSVALGKIELASVKKEKIPSGWGADSKGKETHNPDEAIMGGGLLPLGGNEISGGYKGYGLAMLVEIFCGVLADASYGPNIRRWKDTDRVANLGQCFIAIDPDSVAPGFRDRMQSLMDLCRACPPAEGEAGVLIPGDPERKHIEKCERQGGILYHPHQITLMDALATRLNISKMQRKS